MKTMKNLVFGCILSLFLAITVPSGDMPGPGFSQPPPPPDKLHAATCEPVADGSGQLSWTTVCPEATPNPIAEAMVIAIQIVASVW